MSEIEILTISEEEDDTRIDKILASRYSDVRSRSYFQYLINSGFVTINGESVKKQYRPRTGEEVRIEFILTPELDLTPENIPLDIIYEDEHLLAVNKPVGMVVHPAPGHWSGTFVNALLYHCKELDGKFFQQSDRPGIVHRLDKETSGVLIAAKNSLTQQKLTDLFSSRQIKKVYYAICLGCPKDSEVNAPIGRHPVHRKQMCIREDGGREAITKFHMLATDGKMSVLSIDLITGRTHQIRVHMKHLCTPVLGDSTYGNTQQNKRHKVTRQLLHARSLELKHPITGEILTFTADFPEDMKLFFDKLKYTP
jgi:23S rRNA pseudouridine1911/1915/1917 synthase